MARLLFRSAPTTPAWASPKPVFRVRYELLVADLAAGRIRGQHTVRGCLLAPTDELNVLLADLYEQFRGHPNLMGIHILSVRRAGQAGGLLTQFRFR